MKERLGRLLLLLLLLRERGRTGSSPKIRSRGSVHPGIPLAHASGMNRIEGATPFFEAFCWREPRVARFATSAISTTAPEPSLST